MTDTDLSHVSDSARLAGFLPYLDAELLRFESAIDTRVFQALDNGTLTPEAALNAWIEKRAYRKLGRRFDQRVRMGVSAGDRTRTMLERGEQDNG